MRRAVPHSGGSGLVSTALHSTKHPPSAPRRRAYTSEVLALSQGAHPVHPPPRALCLSRLSSCLQLHGDPHWALARQSGGTLVAAGQQHLPQQPGNPTPQRPKAWSGRCGCGRLVGFSRPEVAGNTSQEGRRPGEVENLSKVLTSAGPPSVGDAGNWRRRLQPHQVSRLSSRRPAAGGTETRLRGGEEHSREAKAPQCTLGADCTGAQPAPGEPGGHR